MANIFDVAKYILEKQGETGIWKLQKLCYYAQAWTLAWTDKPLFAEDFEAWHNGAVSPELYYKYKGKYYIDKEMIDNGNTDNLSDDEKDSINVVLNEYGDWQPYELRERVCNDEPWIIARNKMQLNENSNPIITKESMLLYYSDLLVE